MKRGWREGFNATMTKRKFYVLMIVGGKSRKSGVELQRRSLFKDFLGLGVIEDIL